MASSKPGDGAEDVGLSGEGAYRLGDEVDPAQLQDVVVVDHCCGKVGDEGYAESAAARQCPFIADLCEAWLGRTLR